MEERRKVILREMESELAATDEQRTKYEARQAATMRVIEQLKSGWSSCNIQQVYLCVLVCMQYLSMCMLLLCSMCTWNMYVCPTHTHVHTL